MGDYAGFIVKVKDYKDRQSILKRMEEDSSFINAYAFGLDLIIGGIKRFSNDYCIAFHEAFGPNPCKFFEDHFREVIILSEENISCPIEILDEDNFEELDDYIRYRIEDDRTINKLP